MKPTQEMIEAEKKRLVALEASHTVIPYEAEIREAIRLKMIGSHAGRIGL